MTISVRPTASFVSFRPIRALRWVFAVTVLAAMAGAPVTADARVARTAGPGAFDGIWNVLFTTRAGNCSSTNSVPFTVTGRRAKSGAPYMNLSERSTIVMADSGKEIYKTGTKNRAEQLQGQ